MLVVSWSGRPTASVLVVVGIECVLVVVEVTLLSYWPSSGAPAVNVPDDECVNLMISSLVLKFVHLLCPF